MAAKQHFNNFMIVVSGSHREIKIEGSRRGDVGGWCLEGEGPKREREKATESVHPRLNVFLPLQAVQMGGLITRHMNLRINLLLAL